MNDSSLYIALMALSAATLAGAMLQCIFELTDARRRKVHQRLGITELDPDDAYLPLTVKGDGKQAASGMSEMARRVALAFPNLALSRFIAISLGAGMALFLLSAIVLKSIFFGGIVGVAALLLPMLIVNSRCAKREKQISDQLPDVLEFLSRVLRAGHSLATGLQMIADELPDPLSSEFRRCYDHYSVGQPLEDAMKEMAQRVGNTDFSFFVTAVSIQRQTGGDLAEVLGNIGTVVRSRIRLSQHVKAITAEGRMVGGILLLLPFLFFIILNILNPFYAQVLYQTREGVLLICGALTFQILGLLTIRKIVAIKM